MVPSGGTAGQLLTKNSATNYDTAWMDNYADWTEQIRDTVKAEVAINKGQAVYISGANGTNQLVSLASNATEGTSSKTLGLAMQNLAINGIGAIITEGLLGGLNTSTATAGDPVWLGVSGNLIYGLANKPVAPAHLVYIGVVTRVNSNNGEIYVKIQNGFELQELHNVLISSVANNEGLFYESSTSLWKNKSIATVLGYTPISLTSLSGVSPLSYNNTTGAFSIAQATTSVNGYLSSTDWTTFNGKQAALSGTGFVKASGTTISYDNSTYVTSAYFSATNPLIYSLGNFSIDKADSSLSGYLSSTDWNTFNNKQASGSYITALSGEATASGPGSAAVTLSTSAVTGKLLTGVNITGGSISATDSILVAFGKIQNQINGVLGGAIYQSVWNASTNSPTLTSGTGTKGYYYIVSVAGSTNLDGITDWKVGDWAIFNGTTWDKVDNTDAVSSVNGFTGAVSLTTANISEVTNLYYTEGRVSANTDVAANTAARHASVTIGTANGLSLSTQALSLALASTSATGALSSTDWNTFNLKQAALNGTGFVKATGTTISYDNSTYALDSAVVHNTGTETIGGLKTFTLVPSSTTYSITNGLTSTGTVDKIAGGLSGTGDIVWLTSARVLAFIGLSSAVTSVTASLPLSSSGGATPNITISQATTSANGYLSSTDWNTFNGKQAALTIGNITSADTSIMTITGGTGAIIGSGVNLTLLNASGTNAGIVSTGTQTFAGAKTFSSALNGTSASFTSTLSQVGDFTMRRSASSVDTSILFLNESGVFRAKILFGGVNEEISIYGSGSANANLTVAGTTGRITLNTYTSDSVKIVSDQANTDIWLTDSGTTAGNNRIRSESNALKLITNNTIALTIDSSQKAFFASSLRTQSAYLLGTATDGTTGQFATDATNTYIDYLGSLIIRYAPTSGNRLILSSTGNLTIGSTAGTGTGTLYAGAATFTGALIGTSATFSSSTPAVLTLDATGTYGGGIVIQKSATQIGAVGNIYNYVGLNENGLALRSEGKMRLTTNGATTALFLNTDQSAIFTSSVTANGNSTINGAGVDTLAVNSSGGTNTIQFASTGGATSRLISILSKVVENSCNIDFRTHGSTYGPETIFGNACANAVMVLAQPAAGAVFCIGNYNNGAMVLGTNNAERFRIAASGAITATSSITATSFFESSDSRLKTLIQDNYQTKGIASITPKLYTKNGKVELGYYAQDFVGILDSAVSKGEDDMLSLSYREVHTAKIYALEQRIKELENK